MGNYFSRGTKPDAKRPHDMLRPADGKTSILPVTDVVDVWIMAGQSNTVGENEPDGQSMPEGCAPMPGQILAFSASKQWIDAVPNVHMNVHGYQAQNSVGPDMSFARMLINLGISSCVGLVPTARGGSNLFDEWKPQNELFEYMVDHTRGAMESMPGARLRGMIWVQGEADAYDPKPAAAYSANFETFLATARRRLARYNPNFAVIMAVMSVTGRDKIFPYIQVVREQQLSLGLDHLIKVDMAGYEMFEQWGSLVHITKAGQCAFGTTMGLSYHSWVTAGSRYHNTRTLLMHGHGCGGGSSSKAESHTPSTATSNLGHHDVVGSNANDSAEEEQGQGGCSSSSKGRELLGSEDAAGEYVVV